MSATTRSGLLFGIFAFFANLGLGVLFPICSPLCGIVWGVGAGLAAVAWSDPADNTSTPVRGGAIAGGLAGLGALIGLVIGMFMQFTVLGGQQAANELTTDFSRELGFDVLPGEFNNTVQWISITSLACCLGLANVAIMAGAGAGGAAFYASRHDSSAGNQVA